MDTDRDTQIDILERKFWALIESNIGIKVEHMSTGASTQYDGFASFEASLPVKNKNLKNTPYLFSDSNKLIHFTSLSALFSIINDGSLRLYNLHNCNDENEYTYASKILETIYNIRGIPDSRTKTYYNIVKENSFVLSCSPIEEVNNLYLWNKYGRRQI